MSDDGVSARVPIPHSLLITIKNIREITGRKFSDGDVYTVLKECNMDHNQTVEKLMYIDTFEEVKRKRKVSVNNRGYRRRPGSQWRGGRQPNSHRGNGQSSTTGSASKSSTPDTKKESNKVPAVTSSTATVDASKNSCDGSSSHESTSQSVDKSADNNVGGVMKDTKADQDNMPKNLSYLRVATEKKLSALAPGPTPTSTPTNPSPKASRARTTGGNKSRTSNLVNEVGSLSVSDPVLVPSRDQRNSGAAGIIKRETRNQNSAAEICADAVGKVNIGQVFVGSVDLNEQVTSSVRQVNGSAEEMSESAEVDSKVQKLQISARKSVIFPDHLHVPEAFKNAITFGSLDPFLEQDNKDYDPRNAAVPSNSEASTEPSPTTQSSSPVSRHSDCPDQPQSQAHVLVSSSQENATALRYDQSNQETRSNDPVVSPTPDYFRSFLPTAVGQPEELMPQGGNSTTVSTTQPRGNSQSSIGVSPQGPQQLFPYFRQPYPPNYMSYSPYLGQFYMSPQNGHHLVSHSGYPHQPSAGNVYMTPTASGAKFPNPELKENNMHSTMKQNEDLPSGRDTSALQANYFYNLPAHAQVGQSSLPSFFRPSQPTDGTTESTLPPLTSYPPQ